MSTDTAASGVDARQWSPRTPGRVGSGSDVARIVFSGAFFVVVLYSPLTFLGGEHDRLDQPTVPEGYFAAVSHTVQSDSTALQVFSEILPAQHPLFCNGPTGVNSLLEDVAKLRSTVLLWYRQNTDSIISALYMDNKRLQDGVCKHGLYESQPFILNVAPRTTVGVDIGAMTKSEAFVHLKYLLDSLLCHSISHREFIALEGVVIRCAMTSPSQASRFAFFSIWTLLALRHSPSVEASPPLLRRMCATLSLARGSSSGDNVVEAGRVLRQDDSTRLWQKVVGDVKFIRACWCDERMFVDDGEEDDNPLEEDDRKEDFHEQAVAALLGLHAQNGASLREVGRQFVKDNVPCGT